ncbi:hypothetical protein NL676_037652 [Syzygium grande]|nr:hypothetical protein NL676_037652 [Syzygium grande]
MGIAHGRDGTCRSDDKWRDIIGRSSAHTELFQSPSEAGNGRRQNDFIRKKRRKKDTMSAFTRAASPPLHSHTAAKPRHAAHAHGHPLRPSLPVARSPPLLPPGGEPAAGRRGIAASALALGLLAAAAAPGARAESWGTRSFLIERFFQPGLSPEDAAARIRQTAEGLHDLRGMLDTMSWRYVIFYIRLKSAYLSQDLKNAAATLPEGRRRAYVSKANELVDNMAEFDYYVRTPKVYESYLFYEKTLKSIDDLVEMLA